MVSPESPVSLPEKITHARESVEALLPEDYKTSHKTGWVEVYEPNRSLWQRAPRRRGSTWRDIGSRALGRPQEGYDIAYREHRFRDADTDPILTSYRMGRNSPAKLYLADTIYTPTNPVDGNTSPIRQTSVNFLRESGVSGEYIVLDDGLDFTFLETERDGQPRLTLRARPYWHGDPRFPAYYDGIEEYLKDNGLPSLLHPGTYEEEGRTDIAIAILNFCLVEGQK